MPATGMPATGMPATEFSLIYRYFSDLGRGAAVDLSVGDDCAILRLQEGERLAVSVDTMVAGVHFPLDSFPEDIGYRAVAAAADDGGNAEGHVANVVAAILDCGNRQDAALVEGKDRRRPSRASFRRSRYRQISAYRRAAGTLCRRRRGATDRLPEYLLH